MPKIVFVDTRELEPPEPLNQVLAAVHSHVPNTAICMKHRREPCLLFPILESLGFSHHLECLAEDEYEILIWRTSDTATQKALELRKFRIKE